MSILNVVLRATSSNPTRASSLVAVTAICLAVVCGTGIAAFAGLLPASGGVAVALTTSPLIDIQFDAYEKPVTTMH
jgi:hypothetical protein